ncbi:MAG TPA: hypothetical protein VKA37_10370 [Halobacteriales archaeon]|nr:hypothetical protein [Halobacteriales archaeon]
MASTSGEPPLVPLRLPSQEQWVLHRVLSDRIDRSRRWPETVPPPSPDVRRTVRKVEAGSLLFTVPELRAARETLVGYLQGGVVPDGERRHVAAIVERIDDALARTGTVAPR